MALKKENRANGFESSERIAVIGIGGIGNNAISRMDIACTAVVEFIGMDTDKEALQLCKTPILLQIGKELTKGLGTGARPEIGEIAAKEIRKEIVTLLKDADMAIIICGMGGGAGTGAAPIVSKIAKDMGIYTVGVVTKPFRFEARVRKLYAINGIEKLKDNVDILIVSPCDKWAEITDRYIAFPNVIVEMCKLIEQIVQGIVDKSNALPSLNLNIDDVRAAMVDKGIADMVLVMEGTFATTCNPIFL